MTIVICIAYLALMAVCAMKESQVTGLYKAFGVYGRLTAYLSLFCPLGLGMFVASFFMDDVGFPTNLAYLLVAFLGGLIYWHVYRKCPDFLKKKVIVSLMISGFGVCTKICFFFLGFIWKLTGPQEMFDESGNTVFYYNGNVYDSNGHLVGKASPDRQSFVPIK